MSFFNGLTSTSSGFGNITYQQIYTRTSTNTYTNDYQQQWYLLPYQQHQQQFTSPFQPYYQIPQPISQPQDHNILLLQDLERRIDAKLEELRSLDREGFLKEMLVFTEQQLDSLRSAPRYEAPKPVIEDKRQLELPLELVEEIAF